MIFYIDLTHIGKFSGNDSGDFPETRGFFALRQSEVEWKK